MVVKVYAWGQAGEGEPSEYVTAFTGGEAPREGCTYPEAANYDLAARTDDGSCVAGDGRRLFSSTLPPALGSSPPPPPLATETVVLTLTASGSVSDYSDSDKASLQQKVADAAGVDKSLVTIRVAAASVRTTATIRVPASTTVDIVQDALSSKLEHRRRRLHRTRRHG